MKQLIHFFIHLFYKFYLGQQSLKCWFVLNFIPIKISGFIYTKKKFDPFKNLVLDEYEQELEDALERGEFVSDPNFKENKKMFEEAAKRHIELEESKSITLRIKKKDLMKLKAKAARNNIAYQTLINVLINQYTEGKTKINL